MNKSGSRVEVLSLAILALALGCARSPAPDKKTDEAASARSSAAPAPPPPSSVSSPSPHASPSAAPDITWDAPASWQRIPNPTPLRKATYTIPKVAGDADDAELAVSAAAGGVDANVQRWASQFGSAQPKVDRRTVSGLEVTVVELRGSFNGSMTMGARAAPKEKQMLLGAIVELGQTEQFFKLIGPEKTVSAAKPDFDRLVSSFRRK